MIHAALRGKLSCLDSEDALTCAVFTRLRYLPPAVLCEWLAGARNHLDPAIRAVQRSSDPALEFWPAFKDTYGGRSSIEPDIIIRFEDDIFVVEAKLWSPKSQTGGIDQLAREWHGAVDHYGVRSRVVALIFLTPHLDPPTDALSESAAVLGDDAACLWWLSWSSLIPILERQLADGDRVSRLVAGDLVAYLSRVGLHRFLGWRFSTRRHYTPWTYRPSSQPRYWRATAINNQPWSYSR